MVYTHQELDIAAVNLALAATGERSRLAAALREGARAAGVYPASIGPVYRALAAQRSGIAPLTVPAFNLRGLTYDLARAIWQAVLAANAGPVIFELAPSEAERGDQSLDEYSALVLAAAVREGYRGPVFLQADHIQVTGPRPEQASAASAWCRDALAAGMHQVDLDAADLAGGVGDTDGQVANAQATAVFTAYLRSLEPAGFDLVVGGEVGEIGGRNTSPADIGAFMAAYSSALPVGMWGLGKVSVQTGTTHGGILAADGGTERMPLDVNLAGRLGALVRSEYGMPGVVQHGASTLRFEQLALLPGAGVCEVHLATYIQNLVFDHPAFPAGLRAAMADAVARDDAVRGAESGHAERGDELTPAQRFYRGRWACWGSFKAELWGLPGEVRAAFRAGVAAWSADVLAALRVAGRRALLDDLNPGKVGG